MFLESGKDIETCREAFRSGLRSEQIYGYVGKIRKSSTSSSGVTMQARFWYGASVWEYLLFYVGTFLCLFFVSFGYNGISPVFAALCAMGVTVLFALFSIACSSLTLLGGDDRRELEEFLERSLEQDDP